MKQVFSIVCSLLMAGILQIHAQSYKFDFTANKNLKSDYIKITSQNIFNESSDYGYDLLPAPDGKSNKAFFFSVNVPDGNYTITVTLGCKNKAGSTTVRGESRRLFIENLDTKKNEFITRSFTVNKRNPVISGNEKVKLKTRELSKLNWDDKLTLEFNGDVPCVSYLEIERVENVPTIFLCGNSTVVDQDNEPWASWGQMIPCFFTDEICFANHAESGLSANTFIGGNRLKKIMSQIKEGDYLLVEFGHNDQKQTGAGKGAYYSFMSSLKTFIDEARSKGAYPVLITPTQRRRFDENGKIQNSHGEYPDAVKWLADKENVPLIDLHGMTKILFEALGEEGSIKAFVHYPAGTYPGQKTDLKDNTHFNTYGAYEIAKCVIEGMKKINLEPIKYLRDDYKPFDPAKPDSFESFKWNLSPFAEIEKPDGN